MDNSTVKPNAITENSELVADGKILKVKEKLAHANVLAGTEGTADFYLCEVYDDSELVAETILCIFIAKFEEFTCKLVSKNPARYVDAEDAMNQMLAMVEKHYIAFSAREKECLTTHLH